jgi:hypothetical protein
MDKHIKSLYRRFGYDHQLYPKAFSITRPYNLVGIKDCISKFIVNERFK